MEYRYKVGQVVKYSVMGDVYDFELVMTDGTGRYMVRWINGKGTFWVNKDDLDRYNPPSVENRSVKRPGKKRAAILATLVILVLVGLFVLAWLYSDGSNVVIASIMGTAVLGIIVWAVIGVWRFFFGLFIDKLF
jgi:hypothetical protein